MASLIGTSLVVILLRYTAAHDTKPCSVRDQRAALRSLYSSTSGERWRRNAHWLNDNVSCASGTAHCCWEGVSCCLAATCNEDAPEELTCGCTPGFVVALRLPQNGLVGAMPASVAVSCELRLLDLDSNALTGPIPSLQGLQQLKFLLLGNNRLSGEVHGKFQGLTRLEALDISGNQLEGDFLANMCGRSSSSKLHTLVLADNLFNGRLDVSQCRELVSLNAQGNLFSGPMPDLSFNTRLHSLFLDRNRFNGTIQQSTANMKLLTLISLSHNKLHGDLQDVGVSGLRLLRRLHLRGNKMTGQLLRSMLDLPDLDLSNNRLTGRLPSDLTASSSHDFTRVALSIQHVDLRQNLLSCCGTGLQASAVDLEGPPLQQLQNVYQGVNYSAPRLPPYLLLDSVLQEPDDQGLLCPRLKALPALVDNDSLVLDWRIDPYYFLYEGCRCSEGLNILNLTQPNKHLVISCTLASQPRDRRHFAKVHPWSIVLIIVGCGIFLFVLISLYKFKAGPSFIQQLINMRKRVKGRPTEGLVSIVTTDIEGYSDLMSKCPEIMTKALALHNSIIRRARWHSYGFTMEQEGDSFTLVFYDAFDAVVFCLAAQQMLNSQEWPEGLDLEGKENRISHPKFSASQSRSFLQNLANGLSSKLQGRQERLRTGRRDSSLMHSTSVLNLGDGLQGQASADFSPCSMPLGKYSAFAVESRSQSHTLASFAAPVESRSQSHMVDARTHFSLREAIVSSFTTKLRSSADKQGEAEGEVEGMNTQSSSFTQKLRARIKGRGPPGLFNGLRVRMGVATGVVHSGTPLQSSAVLDAAKAVSDIGSGGQVLLDEPTFQRIKDRLFELGAVDCNGMNYKKLRRIKMKKQMKHGLKWLCGVKRQRGEGDKELRRDGGLQAAVVFDMGLYQWCESKPPPFITATAPSFHARGGTPGFLVGVPMSGRAVSNTKDRAEGGGPGGLSSVHLFSILPPCLMERAKVWGNKLALKKEWVMVTKPYFDAPGAIESALGPTKELQEPLPPVTMVFATVEGAKQFIVYNRKEARIANDLIVNVFINVLRKLGNGYLCRVQGSDLKYMVAFAQPQIAIEWCLAVQDSLMWQDWSPVVLKYEKFKEERGSTSGKVLFRGPRLKMGVTEGPPKTILPDHLGRADYYGNCINNAARFMDAAAHGGMVVCEAKLACRVLSIWNGRQAEAEGSGGGGGGGGGGVAGVDGLSNGVGDACALSKKATPAVMSSTAAVGHGSSGPWADASAAGTPAGSPKGHHARTPAASGRLWPPSASPLPPRALSPLRAPSPATATAQPAGAPRVAPLPFSRFSESAVAASAPACTLFHRSSHPQSHAGASVPSRGELARRAGAGDARSSTHSSHTTSSSGGTSGQMPHSRPATSTPMLPALSRASGTLPKPTLALSPQLSNSWGGLSHFSPSSRCSSLPAVPDSLSAPVFSHEHAAAPTVEILLDNADPANLVLEPPPSRAPQPPPGLHPAPPHDPLPPYPSPPLPPAPSPVPEQAVAPPPCPLPHALPPPHGAAADPGVSCRQAAEITEQPAPSGLERSLVAPAHPPSVPGPPRPSVSLYTASCPDILQPSSGTLPDAPPAAPRAPAPQQHAAAHMQLAHRQPGPPAPPLGHTGHYKPWASHEVCGLHIEVPESVQEAEEEAEEEEESDELRVVPSFSARALAFKLGTYKFKGCNLPLKMAHFVLEDLVPRCKRFPVDPPKGKGSRISKASAEIGAADIELPTLVQQYRARFQAVFTPFGMPSATGSQTPYSRFSKLSRYSMHPLRLLSGQDSLSEHTVVESPAPQPQTSLPGADFMSSMAARPRVALDAFMRRSLMPSHAPGSPTDAHGVKAGSVRSPEGSLHGAQAGAGAGAEAEAGAGAGAAEGRSQRTSPSVRQVRFSAQWQPGKEVHNV